MKAFIFFVAGDRVAVSSASASELAARLRGLAATDESPGFAAAALIEACCGNGGVELSWTAREKAELRLAIEAWGFAGPVPADVTALQRALHADAQAA